MTTDPPDDVLDDLRAALEPREGDTLDVLRAALESRPDDGLTASLECSRVASEALGASLALSRLVEAIDRGELEATPGQRAYLVGAMETYGRVANMDPRGGRE